MLVVDPEGTVIVNMNQVTSIILPSDTRIQFYLATISEDNASFDFANKEDRDKALALILSAYGQGYRVLHL